MKMGRPETVCPYFIALYDFFAASDVCGLL